MKAFATEDIRNLAVIGHGDAGKTQLVSSLLHVAGTSHRWGKVDEGTTVTDYEEDSIERKVSLNNNFAHLEYKDTKINLIDTPGYAAFVSHARPALRVADCALVVVDGVHGIEVQTEKTWQYANEFLLPRFMVDQQAGKGACRFRPRARHGDASLCPVDRAFHAAHRTAKRISRASSMSSTKRHTNSTRDGKAKEIAIPIGKQGRSSIQRANG